MRLRRHRCAGCSNITRQKKKRTFISVLQIAFVGLGVGALVGPGVGPSVGSPVGAGGCLLSSVGAFVGDLVGSDVVGALVGDGVGSSVGLTVGLSVGGGVPAGSLLDSVIGGVGDGVGGSSRDSSSQSQHLSRHVLMQSFCSELDRSLSVQSSLPSGPLPFLQLLKQSFSFSWSHMRSWGLSGTLRSSLSFSQHLARQDLVQESLESWQLFFWRQSLTQSCSDFRSQWSLRWAC